MEDALFHFRLLLEDLQRIGTVVDDQWDKYIAGRLDLAAVSVTTNMALLLAKNLENTARSTLSRVIGANVPQRQATVRQLAKSLGVSEKMADTILKGNIYLPLYNLLLGSPMSPCSAEYYRLEEKVYFNTFMTTTAWHTKGVLQKFSGSRIRCQEGEHGDHTYTGPWEALSVESKKSKSKAFIMETLPELHFLASLKTEMTVKDALSRSVVACMEDKALYMSTVFGMHILLSIHHKLNDASMSSKPLNTLHGFLKSSTSAMEDLAGSLPTNSSRAALSPTKQHMTEVQEDFLAQLKTKTTSGVVSSTPFFTLLRHPTLCGLQLHLERALAQDTALALKRRLGGLSAAVHLGTAFIGQGLIADLGALQRTARIQGDNAFFVGAKPPASKAEYLTAYMLSIGGSVTNLLPASSRTGGLAARKGRKELTAPALFSRAVRDLFGTSSLTEEELVNC